ncbi:MAG TPA: HAD family hydrolase [Steroidobacteraceae bacterium]
MSGAASHARPVGSSARPAVFLDRDGVINRAEVRHGIPHPPASLRDLSILPRVPEALSLLKADGYALIVVTNQPDVARGTASLESVALIHARLQAGLALDAILTCFHDGTDACDCRKPEPGLLLHAAEAFNIDLSSSFMVGDRWRDIEAGRRAGCRTIWIDCGYLEQQAVNYHFRVESLAEAAAIIRGRTEP